MATVRITQNFIEDTRRNINNMQSKEISLARASMHNDPHYRAFEAEAAEAMQKVAWGKYYDSDLRRLLPAEWCCTPSSGVGIDVVDENRRKVVFTDKNALLPPPYSNNYSVSITVNAASLSQESQQLMATYLNTVDAVTAKYKMIKEQVINAFESFGSLNAATKAIPSLLLYVDSSYREKMEEKTVRNKRDASDMPEIDNDLLATVGVTHALGG